MTAAASGRLKRNSTPIIKAMAISVVGLVVFGYAAASGYLWAVQPRLIFKPRAEITETPAAYGLRYEDVFVEVPAASGLQRMHAWWISNDPGNGLTILYLHGAALNIGANSDHARRLHSLGFNVFLISYRGFGRSEGGFPTEESVYEDAEAGWRYLTGERGMDPRALLIYGHSLGAAVAIDLAVRHPEAKGLIVEAAFTSMRAMADTRPTYRFFPIDLILNQNFDSISKVGRLRIPVLYLHGTDDRLVPHRMSRELFDRTLASKRLVFIDGGGHNNSGRVGGKLYLDAVSSFAAFRLQTDGP
jgi:pimeloyl-ACP methyl ester carboxylesterase